MVVEMAKRGPKLKFPKGFRNVQVDIDTYDRLASLAAKDGMKMSAWLRYYTQKLCNAGLGYGLDNKSPAPAQHIEHNSEHENK